MIELIWVTNLWFYPSQTFPTRTEGSVKKHWYKVCDFLEDFGNNKPCRTDTSCRTCTTPSSLKMRYDADYFNIRCRMR
jgi:hypothetical protein